MTKDFTLEVCIGSVRSAFEAAKAGADRVELCENLLEGGTTPSAGSIGACLEIENIATMVMIRPRGGDFLYTESEFDIMKRDALIARNMGAHGLVFGILRPDGTFDQPRMKQLIELAAGLDITCHRAFDMTPDPFAALETLVELGIKRVLTSGQMPKAPLGADLISKLVKQAAGRISIMPGAGVNETTIQTMVATGAREFHIAPTLQAPSGMLFRNPTVTMGVPDRSEFEITITDHERVAKVVNYLRSIK